MAEPPRILVVDDDDEIRTLIGEVLRDEGYEVVTVPHGAAALAEIDKAPPRVIVLDMKMPVMDGWAFARTYRAKPGPHAPIIVTTAAADAGQRAAQIDADDVLAKPFDIDGLLAVIGRYVR